LRSIRGSVCRQRSDFRIGRRIGDNRRQRRVHALSVTAVDLEAHVLEDEGRREARGGLSLAENQDAAFAKRERKELERASLQLGREVDQDVAAEHEVDAREWRPSREIVLAEDDGRADRLREQKTAVR